MAIALLRPEISARLDVLTELERGLPAIQRFRTQVFGVLVVGGLNATLCEQEFRFSCAYF